MSSIVYVHNLLFTNRPSLLQILIFWCSYDFKTFSDKFSNNHGHDILKLCNILEKSRFTRKETLVNILYKNILFQIIVPRRISRRKFLPNNPPPPGQFSRGKIVFRTICCIHNCPSDKWFWGKNIPRINFMEDIFSQRIRNSSTLIYSCFFLVFFFEF